MLAEQEISWRRGTLGGRPHLWINCHIGSPALAYSAASNSIQPSTAATAFLFRGPRIESGQAMSGQAKLLTSFGTGFGTSLQILLIVGAGSPPLRSNGGCPEVGLRFCCTLSIKSIIHQVHDRGRYCPYLRSFPFPACRRGYA